MKLIPIRLTAFTVACLAAVSCGVSDPVTEQSNVVQAREKKAETAPLPRVITPGWHVLGQGRPSLDVTGFPRVTYAMDADSSEFVDVFYHGRKNPRVETTSSESVTIMGCKLQTYDSGNEDPAFSTQPVLLTAPNGKPAYYSFQFTGKRLVQTRQVPAFGW